MAGNKDEPRCSARHEDQAGSETELPSLHTPPTWTLAVDVLHQ